MPKCNGSTENQPACGISDGNVTYNLGQSGKTT